MQAKALGSAMRRTTVEAHDQAAPRLSPAVVSHTTRSRPSVDAMAPAIASAAGQVPPTATSPILVGGRDWIAATRFVPMNNAEIAARLLATVRDHVRNGGPPPLLVVDLDYTLYNNDPRMAHVIREWAASDSAAAFPEARATLARFAEADVRYSLADCLTAAGIDSPTTTAVMKSLLPFFLAKFFDNEHTVLDSVIEDVRALLTKVTDAGARVVFLTGRLEHQQGVGTRTALARDGFAIDDRRYVLFLKPSATHPDGSKYSDTEYKRDVKPSIEALGTVVATLDNEPGNVVGFAASYPSAMNVFVDTKWSDAKVAPGNGLYRFAPR